MSTPSSFNQWLTETYGIEKWVLARKTKRMQERYPASEFFTPTRYRALCEEHRQALREDKLIEIASEFGVLNYPALRAAFEAGRGAR